MPPAHNQHGCRCWCSRVVLLFVILGVGLGTAFIAGGCVLAGRGPRGSHGRWWAGVRRPTDERWTAVGDRHVRDPRGGAVLDPDVGRRGQRPRHDRSIQPGRRGVSRQEADRTRRRRRPRVVASSAGSLTRERTPQQRSRSRVRGRRTTSTAASGRGWAAQNRNPGPGIRRAMWVQPARSARTGPMSTPKRQRAYRLCAGWCRVSDTAGSPELLIDYGD